MTPPLLQLWYLSIHGSPRLRRSFSLTRGKTFGSPRIGQVGAKSAPLRFKAVPFRAALKLCSATLLLLSNSNPLRWASSWLLAHNDRLHLFYQHRTKKTYRYAVRLFLLEGPVGVSPEGPAPRQHSDALVQSQGCKIPSGCIETLSASLSRQLTVEYDYVWFVPSGAVKDDLRHATLVALPVPGHGAGEPIGILTRVDATFSSGCQLMINAIRKSMPF